MPNLADEIAGYIVNDAMLDRGIGADAPCRGHTFYPTGFYKDKTNTAACPQKDLERHCVVWSGPRSGKRLVAVEIDKAEVPKEYACNSFYLAILAADEDPHNAYGKCHVQIDAKTGAVMKHPKAKGMEKEEGWKAWIDFISRAFHK